MGPLLRNFEWQNLDTNQGICQKFQENSYSHNRKNHIRFAVQIYQIAHHTHIYQLHCWGGKKKRNE